MTVRILYYGTDISHRLMVLTTAGFTVEHCVDASQLATSLDSGKETAAVLISDYDSRVAEEAVVVARAHSSAPVILFRDSNHNHDEADFDFIIPNLTQPQSWLQDIAGVINRGRGSVPHEVLPIGGPPGRITLLARDGDYLDLDRDLTTATRRDFAAADAYFRHIS